MAFLGTTDKGEEVEINKRAAESRPARLREHQPRRDGRRLEVDRHRPRQLPAASATTTTSARCSSRESFMDQHRSELHSSNWRMGKVHPRRRREGLPDRDDAQHRHVPVAVRLPHEAGVGVDGARPGLVHRPSSTASTGRRHASARQIFQSIKAPHQMTSVQAGEVERRARGDHAQRVPPAARGGRGPDRHPHDGPALHLPVQRQLDHEPDPRDVPRARLLLQPVPRASRWCARAAC